MLKQPNLSARIGCFNTAPQLLPTTILPQSWLTGLVALTRRRNSTNTCQPNWGNIVVGRSCGAVLKQPTTMSARIGVKSLLVGVAAPQLPPTTMLPQSWLTGLVALKQPNLSARILADRFGCFNTAPQLLPTTILPQSLLVGLVALTQRRNSHQQRFYPNPG